MFLSLMSFAMCRYVIQVVVLIGDRGGFSLLILNCIDYFAIRVLSLIVTLVPRS